jgi:plasmid stabilization system protein ParE
VRRLTFTDAATDNLLDIAVYIATESGSRTVAVNFTNRLRDKCRQLASLPATLGTARPELRADIRSTPCLGYVIFFRYQADALEVVNVLHGQRDIVRYFEAE